MEQNINKEEAKALIDVIISKGNDLSLESMKVIKKIGLNEKVMKIYQLEQEAMYADSVDAQMRDFRDIKEARSELVDNISSLLKESGFDIPVLSEDRKKDYLKGALKDFGFSEKDIENFISNDMVNAETIGKGFELNFKNDEKVKKTLQDKGIDFEEDGEKLKVKGKLYVTEGFEIDNTAEHRLKLESNDIMFFKKAEDERKLFVPLRAKKVGMLLAMGIVGGPVGALAIQIVLNQTGLLDKMLDKHLLSPSQKKSLKEGFTILAAQRENGKDVKQFMFVDKETGKINKVNVNDIQIPRKFRGIDLTTAQINSLKNGRNVTLDVDGREFLCRLDLNEKSGIKVAGFKEFKSDREFTKIPTVNSPDVEKLKYISFAGKQGIDDIFGRGGDRLERDTFLEKYNLKEQFYKIDMALAGNNPMMAASAAMKEKFSQLKELAGSVLFGIEEEQSKSKSQMR